MTSESSSPRKIQTPEAQERKDSPQVKEPPSQALGQLQEETLTELKALLRTNENGSSLKKHLVEKDELSEFLFAKAPEEFLLSHTKAELVEIVNGASQAIDSYLSEDGKLAVHRSSLQSGVTHFFMALGDRPFIINSLRECLLAFGGNISVILHPIIIREGYRISLSFVELTSVSEEESRILQKHLEQTLKHVVSSTEDFTSMLVRVETVARLLESTTQTPPEQQGYQRECAEFLRWLTNGGLIFVGSASWNRSQLEPRKQSVDPDTALGVVRLEGTFSERLVEELREDLQHLLSENLLIDICRVRSESYVQRRSPMLAISLRELAVDGSTQAVHQVVGLLTSKALSEEASAVPFIRRKLHDLLTLEGAIENSHDYKNIVNIFDSMPKDEVLCLSVPSLRSLVHTILDIQNKNETRVSIKFDHGKRSASVLIVMPRDRFNSEVRHHLQRHIENTFGAPLGSSEYFLDLSNKPHARFYFHIPLSERTMPQIDLARLKLEVGELTQTWLDRLEDRILRSNQFRQPGQIWKRYRYAFPEEYQALQLVEDCEHDIRVLEGLDYETTPRVSMRPAAEREDGSFTLVVYNLGHDLTISEAFPVLDNVGLEVLSERAFQVTPSRKPPVFVHRFVVRPRGNTYITPNTFEMYLAPGLSAIFRAQVHNDPLNSLLIQANLDIHAIRLLRAYTGLLWQVNKFATRSAILNALAQVPAAANQLWNLFEIRFNPHHGASLESREKRFRVSMSTFQDSLRDVQDITHDRVLRALASLLEHTVRTNFYRNESTIALKLDSKNIDGMPEPRPHFEIYVYSEFVEGVHLRSGPIARGGIRWSDRVQDYRTEVLDLMKTQRIKNALIVPSGAKGGFIVKQLPEERDEQRAAVKSAYQLFIRSLLSVTDNRVEGEIVHPENVICHDEEDPYFVVAADKGTATYSDVANKIAVDEYQFWLGDAFASGGSEGYDHKLYGITARGAWESVKRHFHNIGLNFVNKDFTAVGIGDMSGDVFGNGLLMSDRFQLVGAFNHRHIFLDPNPDSKISYQERKRLFETPGSQWSDYNQELISDGGGVFGRFEKEIELSPAIRRALGISDSVPETVDGETLISLILKADVDLLWNGGIGTYVKSKHESNADVNDGTNDRVRIDAEELRARVVGEGGNLGFTQRARIEFARKGGNIHTDAIDNSAGVDLSDHEVNLKILFRQLMQEERLTCEERNDLLRQIGPDVVEKVLLHNKNHALSLTLGFSRSKKNIDYFRTLIRELVRKKYINRRLEQLPEDEELIERSSHRQGLWKPELAVSLGGVKLWIKEEFLATSLPEDPLLEAYLLDYFPKTIQEQYRAEILAHPLARHIATTEAMNQLIDMVGITFVHRMCLNHSTSVVEVMKCTLAAELLLGARKLRKALFELDSFDTNQVFRKLLEELHDVLREVTAWFLNFHQHLTLKEMVELYRDSYRTLADAPLEVLAGTEREMYQLRLHKYGEQGLGEQIAQAFALFPRISVHLEMLWATRQSSCELSSVAGRTSEIIENLGLEALLSLETSIDTRDKWETELVLNAYQNMRRSVSSLACEMLTHEATWEDLCKEPRFLQAIESVKTIIDEAHDGSNEAVGVAVVAQHLLRLPKMLGKMRKQSESH